MSKRRTHSPEFKARVAMEAISGRKTIQEIAADHAIHPIQVSQWKRQLLDGASELFTRGKKSKDTGESQVKEAELFQQIGKLQMELEWLKKKISAALTLVNFASWSITTIQSSASVVNVPCWVCPDPRFITGRHRCGNRRCASWPGSMLSTWRIRAAVAAGWWSNWPERESRSAAIGCETSCAAWVYGRSRRSHAPRFQGTHPVVSLPG
jgi:transposase-like protein